MSENDWRTEPMTIKDLQSNLAGIVKQFPGAEDFIITVKTETGRHDIVRGLIIQTPNPFFSEEDAVGSVQFFTPATVDYFNKGWETFVLNPDFAVIPRTAKDFNNDN